MSFEWENGYRTHECRDDLCFCAHRKMDMQATINLLRFSFYVCGEEEIQEYLKLYPLTQEELHKEKVMAFRIRKMISKYSGIKKRERLLRKQGLLKINRKKY